jgi:hypothetical protein
VLNASRQAGGAIGVALLGALSLHVAMVVAGAVFLSAAGVTALTVERRV